MHANALALFLALALALPLTSSGCAAKKTAPPPDVSAKGLSPAAAADYFYLLYQEFSRQGQVKEAVAVLEKLIELAPSPELYRDLANLHWGLGEADRTREILRQGLAKYPDQKTLHFYLANSYLLQRNFDEAVTVLKGYLAKHPKDQSASQELGAVLVEAGRFQEALDLLAQVPKDKRTPAMAYYESKAYAGLGKRKQATEKLRQALREDPNMLAAWSELAFTHEQAGEYRQAEEAYRRIMDLGEDGPELWYRLIRLALKQKNESKALQLLEKAPSDQNFLMDVMTLFTEEGLQDGAAKVLERLGQAQPGNVDLLFLQAMMAVEKEKNLEKAADLLSKVPRNHKEYGNALISRIQLLIDLGQFPKAVQLIEEGRKTFPDSLEFVFLEALLYEKQGNLDKVGLVYAAARKKWPDNTEVLYRYGTVLERQKKRAESMAVMESIIAKEPNHADALNFIGYALAEDGRDLDRALALITKALQGKPASPYILDSLAWVHFKRGDLPKAWEAIVQATAKPVDDPTIWEHYGDIAKAMGNRQEAEKGYRKALDMNPPNAAEIKARLESLK